MLNKHDYKYKKFLKLEKKYNDIYRQIRKLPLTKLEEPYQKGWIITYELRADVKRRKDASILQQVIDMTYHSGYTRAVGDVKAIRSGHKYVPSKTKKGEQVSLIPQRRSISKEAYEKLTPQLEKYFSLDIYSKAYELYGHKRYHGSLPEHWMVLKARPNIITHISTQGGPLESEYQKIRQQLFEYWRTKRGYGYTYPKESIRTETRAQIQKVKKGESEDVIISKTKLLWD